MPIEHPNDSGAMASALAGSAAIERSWSQAMTRGAAHTCPACGAAPLYASYLRVNDTCPSCRSELHHHRADDAPPYFTIFIAGHILLGLMLTLEQVAHPPIWLHLAIVLPLCVVLCLALLPRIKGALVGLQWALRMHGFSGTPDKPPA